MMEINLLNNHLKKASAAIVNKIQNKFIKKNQIKVEDTLKFLTKNFNNL